MIEINDDETASRIYTEIDNATGDERMQMADALGKYGEKKLQEEYNTNDEHYSKMFMDDAYNQEYKGRSTAIKEAVNPDETWQRGTIQGYLSHRLGRDVTADNYEIERDAFSMSAFGQKNINDGQLFDNIKGDYEWQNKKTEALNDLHRQSVGKAINDSQLGQNRPFVDGMTDVFNTWQQKYPELVDGTNDAAFLSQGYKLYYDTINDLDSVRPQAAQTLTTLEKFTKGESDPEALQTLSNTLIGASPEERQKIYKYVTLAAEAGHIDRAGLDQFALNMGQSFSRGFDFVPQGSLQMQEAGVNNWLESIRNGTQIWVPVDGDLSKAEVGNAPAGVESDAWRQATVPEAETLIQSGQNVREGFKVVRELRNVAKTGVDPIRPVLEEKSFWGTAERGAYGLAGSIPLMGATAVNPFLGVIAYQANEYDRIMLENPDVNPQFAQGLALVEGAANAAIDRVQLKSLSGKLPMFGRYLDRIKSDGIRRTVKIGANVVEQNLQEGAQDLIAPVLETAVAALREDMPDKDFSSLMEGWAGQRAETFFATLPLSLIGGGVATFRDIKHPSEELNATKLRMAGFSPEQTTFIQRAENPEEYDARIQMEFPNRTPDNIKAGEELIQQSISEAQNPPENSAKLEETVAKDGTRMWTVTTPDGKELLQTKDQQAALVAIREHNGAQIINERNTVADMVDYFRAQDPTNSATIEAPRNVQQELDRLTEAGDYKGIVNLSERIQFAGIPEDADLTSYNILGEANVETTAEGVFRGVIKLRENSRPEDAFEEINHVFVRKAIAEGRVDLDSLRGWLTQTSEATGEAYATETETDIIENIAKVGMDYAAGRIEETSLPASFVDYIKRMLQVFKETMARALKLKDAFATGKIDASFESFLADSVGLNQQARVDTASQRVAGDVLADTDGKVVFSRAQAQSNAGEIRASNATITGPTNYSIAAHHGTPHKVDKFTTGKIGTGEGAQAYGWGLYFAEEKKVALEYQSQLAPKDSARGWSYNGKPLFDVSNPEESYTDEERAASYVVSEMIDGGLSFEQAVMQNKQDNAEAQFINPKAFDSLKKDRLKDPGNLYTVDLDVEPEDLLDWDKPLSEQSPKVKAALQSVSDNWLWQDAISGKGGERVGGALYSTLRATFPDAEFSRDGVDASKKASEALLAAGIPGIRYLDGGSRSEGQGTYNYVAFDENLIKITEENGNRIAAADAFTSNSKEVSTDTSNSIWVDLNDSLEYRKGNGSNAITASQKIARDIAASSQAIQNSQSGTSEIAGQILAIERADGIPWQDVESLGRPDTEASEHLIWFFPSEGKVFKATAYGRFGHSISKGSGKNSPLEYLRRIAATNEAFDDTATIIGKFRHPDGALGLVHAQDFIVRKKGSKKITFSEIERFLFKNGFLKDERREAVFVNKDIGIEVADAHPGNFIKSENGTLVPIDVLAFKFDETKGVNYSIASQSEIDRVNKALGGMNRGPDERLKVYQRAKNSFSRVMQENKEALDAIRSSVSTDTAPATERVEMDRAGKMADVSSEEKTELEKALQDNADTFLPRIEAAQTPAERKKVERDAKDRAKILEQGIRDKFAERKKSVDAEAKSQRDQIVQAAAAKDSASNARMRDKVRHTKLVNAIGELDGILKALPPEVRGRVGGFAVLANIGTGDKALADFFVQRIDMIDRQLERTLKEEYGTQFDALLERTKPKKAKAGEKPKGIGADIQSLFSAVREARGWNPDKVDGHIANLETQIAAGNLTPEEEAWLTREADLVSLAGDWKNADSSRRAAALEAATETWAKGMYEFVQKKMQEREARDIARAEAIKATGKKGDYPDRRARSEADNGLKGKSHGWLMDTMSWDQVAGIVFGHESPIAIELSDGQRKAEYTKIDAVQAKEDAIHDLFTQLAGGSRLEGEKLMWKMSQPSIDAGGLNLSQLEALSPTMLWAQEDGRRHMIGQLDETGNPTSRWHYNQQFIDDIESQLSPEAKAVRDFLWDSYEKEWFSINSVNRELNGISLPRIFKYSPVTVNPINVPAGMVSDPVTGNTVSAGSISPGALRTRGTAIAQPNFRNVISTYIAHTRQMEHWKAFAPWTKVANGILRNRDVQDSIHEAGGEEANKVLNRFLDAFAQGGNRDASLGLEISQTLSRMTSRAAQVALVGRVGTLAIQFTQIGAASAELPMGAYVSRLGKLMTGNLSWTEALNSPYIQRRIKQMPPSVQIAMEGLKAGKPNQLKHQVTKVGQLISGSDALWTAGTYAMVYDYHLGQAKSFGFAGQAAEEYAHNTAERVTDRLAQPTRMGARSIYEITSTNPGSKLGWAFASEARKNLALLAYTKANRSAGQFGTAALGFVLFNLAMGAFIRNAWKDMKDDDDDELFDEKTWNWKRIGVAMLTEPLQGIPYLGDYIEKGINAALGQYHQSSDLISFERGVRAIKHIPDIIDGERDMEGVLKDIDGMVSLMGMFNQSAAAAASLTHIASDFFGVAKNATTED